MQSLVEIDKRTATGERKNKIVDCGSGKISAGIALPFIGDAFARNLGSICDEQLSFTDVISALSKSCYSHIREHDCIRHYLVLKTTNTIASCHIYR